MLYSIIFGFVVERNRVDVIMESGPLHCSPPEGAWVEGRRQTFLAARQLGRILMREGTKESSSTYTNS